MANAAEESTQGYVSINGEQLSEKLLHSAPDNTDRRHGFALVNVLDAAQFERAHIPGSINIPQGEEQRFDDRFDKDKDIVVYCASTKCDASEKAAKALAKRGFRRVQDYADGLTDWRQAGRPITGTTV